jgi:hypothetical protein
MDCIKLKPIKQLSKNEWFTINWTLIHCGFAVSDELITRAGYSSLSAFISAAPQGLNSFPIYNKRISHEN